MLTFPHAKINIGLRIIEKRNDGFHNLETVFYPVKGLYDSLEFIESNSLKFEISGIQVNGPIENNLCVKAWNILHEKFNIPPVSIHLQKNIPFGAGLGGGSADAAFMLKALNTYFNIGLSNNTLEKLALELGSDCPFFINCTPTFAEGRGELFTPIEMNLKGKYIILANPNIHVSTTEAYAGVIPHKSEKKLLHSFPENLQQWNRKITNDFEKSVFKSYPAIQKLKEEFYNYGALYASMSGSGSTVFGIFDREIQLNSNIPVIFQGKL